VKRIDHHMLLLLLAGNETMTVICLGLLKGRAGGFCGQNTTEFQDFLSGGPLLRLFILYVDNMSSYAQP
jgi:hypothetical protein